MKKMNLEDIHKKVYSKTMEISSIEKCVSLFLENFISQLKRITYNRLPTVASKPISLKDRIFKHRVVIVADFLDGFNNVMAEKALEWADLAKRWTEPRLVEEIEHQLSEQELTKIIDDCVNKTKEFAVSLLSVDETYKLSGAEKLKLEGTLTKLEKASKMDYNKIIGTLKQGNIYRI